MEGDLSPMWRVAFVVGAVIRQRNDATVSERGRLPTHVYKMLFLC